MKTTKQKNELQKQIRATSLRRRKEERLDKIVSLLRQAAELETGEIYIKTTPYSGILDHYRRLNKQFLEGSVTSKEALYIFISYVKESFGRDVTKKELTSILTKLREVFRK